MNRLMTTEDREIKQNDSVRKTSRIERIRELKEKISDESYIDHAINKLATDLSHYLTN